MKLGFIGCGNMASAMIGGIIKNHILKPEDIIASDLFAPSREKAQSELGICVTENNNEVVEASDIIVLSIKPQFYEAAIAEIKDLITEKKIILTIAPGKTLEWLGNQFGKDVKIIRTMPNTPAMVLEGITSVCHNINVTPEEVESASRILRGFGKVELMPENLMDVAVSTGGSSPAYVYVMIEAMADAAVADGMPRAQAYRIAAQAVLGSAKMVLETGTHPGELKDMVCSPGGTTIAAIGVLEEKGFRSAIIEAMKTCTKKAKGL